jgi:dUTP pyrophosphatase
MEVFIMKILLDAGAKMPFRAHDADAGYDLFAKEDFVVPPCTCDNIFGTNANVGSAIHDTGVHIAIPRGYVGFIKSKSGLNVKHGLTAEGVVDAEYCGAVLVKLYNHTAFPYCFKKGDKITQLVILPIFTPELELVDSLEETERGDNGFGSTGK